MSDNRPAHWTPRDVARVLCRHSKKIALVFCGVTALTLLTIAFYPRSYGSEAKLLIRIGRESVALDPTATTGETITLQKTPEDEVNSAVCILNSRTVLEGVVNRVGAERIMLDDRFASTANSETDGLMQGLTNRIVSILELTGLYEPGTEMDRAVRHLENGVRVTAPRQTMVITIGYKAGSPKLAQDVVQAWTDVFLAEHSRLSQTDGSLRFFAEQVDKLHSDLTAAQERLRDRKNRYQLTSAASRKSILEKGKDAMRQKVYDLKIRENDLMSRYTDDYPPLREVRRQRLLAEKMLLDAPWNKADSGLVDANGGAGLSALAAQGSSVAEASADTQVKLNAELQTLNTQDLELAQLDLEVKLLQAKYAMHVNKLEQARLNEALGREQISNVKIAQPATLVHKPASPKKALLLLGGLVLAVVGSVGTACVAENLDQTLCTTDQVESQLGLPVLASLPHRESRRAVGAKSHSAERLSDAGVSERANHRAGCRGLLATLRSMGRAGKNQGRAVAIVGCDETKLRSRIAGNLAVEAAASGTDTVLLIDADPRNRNISKRFHLNGAPGWRDLIAGKAQLENCLYRVEASNLAVIGPGTEGTSTNGHLSNGDERIPHSRLDQIKSHFGFVVVDLPPTSEFERAPDTDRWFDQAVLVVEAEQTRIQAAKRASDILKRSGVEVTGVVLANRREYIPRWLYQRL